jgi:hypothetical protein
MLSSSSVRSDCQNWNCRATRDVEARGARAAGKLLESLKRLLAISSFSYLVAAGQAWGTRIKSSVNCENLDGVAFVCETNYIYRKFYLSRSHLGRYQTGGASYGNHRVTSKHRLRTDVRKQLNLFHRTNFVSSIVLVVLSQSPASHRFDPEIHTSTVRIGDKAAVRT